MRLRRALVDNAREWHHVGPSLARFCAREHIPPFVGPYPLEPGAAASESHRRHGVSPTRMRTEEEIESPVAGRPASVRPRPRRGAE
jgi:hypothetical protein